VNRQLARALRKRLTEAERLLWRHLRNRELGGWKFKRQYPVGPFIVDFICVEKNLVIEVDGGQHAEYSLESEPYIVNFNRLRDCSQNSKLKTRN